jgi:endonuclease G
MDETFLLTNIAPQIGEGFNRHYWAYVEDFCRRLTGSFEDVYVFTWVMTQVFRIVGVGVDG